MTDVGPLVGSVLVHGITAFGIGGLLGGLAMTWWQRRRVARSSVSTAAPEAVRQGSGGFEQSLRTLHAAGRWDEVLLRLLPAMQEARAGLTELMLAGSGGDQLRRAEGRVRALAATARELKEFEPGPTPG